MRSANFLGPTYVGESKTTANTECINLYPEVNDVKGAKGIGALYACPGLDLLLSGGPGPQRGSIKMQDVLYCVAGNGFYRVSSVWVPTRIGTVGMNSTLVSMITNGLQIAIFDGSSGWVYTLSSGAFAPISLPFAGPLSATYQDGFGLVNEVGTNIWWQSNLLDLSMWQALNFSSADSQPDNVVAIESLKREVWLIKETDSEIWINAGLPGFAFQRLEGVFIEAGIAAPNSLAKCGEVLAWISQTEEGSGVVVATNGYSLQRISTHFIEQRIQSYRTMSDAVGYSYQQKGHLFYVLNFTAGNETWVYDFSTSVRLGEPCWHKRAAFLQGQFNRHWGQTHVEAYGKTVIGDYLTGNLYAFDIAQALDNGQQRRWLRSWRALDKPSEDPVSFDSLRIDMMTGINVPAGTNPQCVLRWSDDGGYNWRATKYAAAGKIGETTRRVRYKRMGATKSHKGLDRMFELSSSDVFGVSLVGAELN